jgi:hypothetical protein
MRFVRLAGIFALVTVAYLILWMSGIVIGGMIFPAEIAASEASDTQALLMMLGAAGLNTLVLMVAVACARWRGIKLTATIAAEIFGIQFFMSQIETLLFNTALGLPENLIYTILFGGLMIALGVPPLLVWLMGKMRGPEEAATFQTRAVLDYVWRIGLLAVLIYPALYILAGHFIAWQFPEVRALYTGSTAGRSFMDSLIPFVTDGLWGIQIVRGALWILIGAPVLWMTRGGFPRSGLVLGLLFAVLMNAQHLIPNPYMPGIIPLAHGIETATSNFVWGFAIAWLLTPKPLHEATARKDLPPALRTTTTPT